MLPSENSTSQYVVPSSLVRERLPVSCTPSSLVTTGSTFGFTAFGFGFTGSGFTALAGSASTGGGAGLALP